MDVKISVSGLKEFTDRMTPLGKQSWIHQAVNDGIRIMYDGTLERFDAEVDPNYAAWAPLRPSTLKRKKGSKKLVESGDLRGSIQIKGINQFASKIVAADHPGKFHQDGTSRMVARPFMGASSRDNDAVRDMVLSRIRGMG